jgi:hypothetical protein
MNESQIIIRPIIETRRDAAKVLQPSDQALDLPAPFVSAKHSPVLRFRLHAINFVRCNQLDALDLRLALGLVKDFVAFDASFPADVFYCA